MPVTSASQVAERMVKCAEAVRASQAVAARAASLELKASVLAVSPRRLRNVGKRGGALGVSTSVTGGEKPTATGKATGPWPIIENDTPPHTIGPRRKRAKGRRAAIKLGGDFRGSVRHPGTKGKQLFHKGVALGTPKAVAIMRQSTVTAVKGVF